MSPEAAAAPKRGWIDPATRAFLGLTPDLTLDAVEAAGLRCSNTCLQLNSFENRVYEIALRDGTPLVVKLYRPGRWTEAQILEEHLFLEQLSAAEVPVCPVLRLPSGETLGRHGVLMWSVSPRRGGRAPEEVHGELAKRLGGLVGRIHNVGGTLRVPHRLRLDADRLDDTLDWMLDTKVIAPTYEDRYVEAGREIAAMLEERLRGVPVHAVHGDLHLGNLILRDGALNVLDFDDMMTGPACQDLWLLFPGRDLAAKEGRRAFLDGYRQFRPFEPAWLRLIEPLRGFRYITYAAWLARRWHDPIFPATWPQFGDDKWWHSATRDLEEVLTLCDEPTL